MRVRVGALGLYAFGVALLYLAGAYFGRFFVVLFYLSLLFPLASYLLTVAAVRHLHCIQRFDNQRPAKGDQTVFRLILLNDSVLPLYRVTVHLTSTTPLPATDLATVSTFLGSRERFERSYQLRFPFRGVYTLGAERVEATDLLQLFGLAWPVRPQTFTVYPLVHRIAAFPAGGGVQTAEGRSGAGGALPDYSLYSHLRGYRSGDSLRHLSWKQFASRGVPLIKEYETLVGSRVRLILDLRQPPGVEGGGLQALERLTLEDTSVEIAVALVRYFLDRGVRISVLAPGSTLFRFEGTSAEHFQGFYAATVSMSFHDAASPAAVCRAAGGQDAAGVLTIVVTHLADAEVLGALEAGAEGDAVVILNHAAQPGPDGGQEPFLEALRDRGVGVVPVRRARSLREELEGGNA